jgi:hypothetical protein
MNMTVTSQAESDGLSLNSICESAAARGLFTLKAQLAMAFNEVIATVECS